MIFVLGWIRLDQSDVTTLAPAAQSMMAETRKEDGCLAYSFAQDLGEEGLIHVTEQWRDEAALNGHFQTPHMEKFNAALGQVNIKAMDIRLYAGDEMRVLMQR